MFVLVPAAFIPKADRLDDANLVSGVESIVIGCKTNVSLLQTIGSNESVDSGSFNIIHALDGILDLMLVGLDVNDEDQSVVVLNLLHGALSCKRILQDGMLVELVHSWDRSARVLGSSVKLEGLGATEVNVGTDLTSALGVCSLCHGLLDLCCLSDRSLLADGSLLVGWLLGNLLLGSSLGGSLLSFLGWSSLL